MNRATWRSDEAVVLKAVTRGCSPWILALSTASCAPQPAPAAPTPVSPSPVPSGSAEAPGAPAPDSLTPEEYVSAGVPASDRLWSRMEYTNAAAALAALVKRNPNALPRLRDPRSGALFARVVDPQNLQTESSAGLGGLLPILKACGTLLKTYLSAHDATHSFAHELAALQVFSMKVGGRFLEAALRLELPKDEPGHSKAEQGRAEIVSGIAEMVSGLLTSLEERRLYDRGDRALLASSVDSDGMAVVAILPRLTRLELCERLHAVASTEPDQDVKAVLLGAESRGCGSR